MKTIEHELHELAAQLNIELKEGEDLIDVLEGMGLVLGLDSKGSWVVVNTDKEIVAQLD